MGKVVDANVFLHGRGSYNFDEAYVVQEVYDEVKSQAGQNQLMNLEIKVINPSESSLEKIKQVSAEINSPTSEEDELLLALALETSKTLVTDDKPLQNLALHLDIDFEGFLDDPADQKFRWENQCESCGKAVKSSRCPRCGSQRFQRKRVRCSS